MLNLSRPFPYLLTFLGRSPQSLAAKNPSLSIRFQIRPSGPQNKMSGNEIALNKTEAKSYYVWIQTNDGLIQQVEGEFVTVCPLIHREMLRTGLGSCKNNPIPLPEQVSPAILSSILHYCRFHQVPGHSDKERKSFDEKFMKTDTDRLVELISAAHSLELSPLVDLISRAIARIIEGSSNDEIREIFRVPDDLTEEEKLEPLRNPTNNLYIRLLNQHLARKRKNLKEQKELKNVELEKKQEDKRTVEELLELINGKDEDLKCVRASKCKRKSKKRKNKAQSSSVNYLNCPDVKEVGLLPPMRTSDDGAEDFSCTETEFDDDLDQEKMRENDRIVAEFARRLRLIDYR